MSKLEFKVQLVQPQQAMAVWKRVREMLRAAIDESNGRWRQEYVFANVTSGRQQLWVVVNTDTGLIFGAGVTEIIDYPEKRCLNIHYLAGSKFDGWYNDMLQTFKGWAKDNHCDMLECLCRPGFKKWFENSGWGKPTSFYEMNLKEADDGVPDDSED